MYEAEYFFIFWTPYKHKNVVTVLDSYEMIMSRGERDMTKNKLARYIANTALVAVLAAAGIGVYQLGTTPSEKSEIQEESLDTEKDQTEETKEETEDVGTTQVEAKTDSAVEMDKTEEKTDKDKVSEETAVAETAGTEENGEQETVNMEVSSTSEEQVSEVAANAAAVPKLSFSEDTLMDWPVNGSILLDYNMDQTVYFPTLDQYKLSPAIAVGAVEGAPVTASVKGMVYSVEDDPQTGTTLTMELGGGYQAIYGQLKDLTVKEGDMVEKGTVIGYIATPTKYYSNEGSNLYFAMKKNGEPVDPIAYLP